MSFTSIKYIIFLTVVVVAYFRVPEKLRKPLLLLANLVFYALWEPLYCLLLAVGILLTYFCGLAMQRNWGRRRYWWAFAGSVYLLGVLLVFKYLDFFAQLLAKLLGGQPVTNGLLLPVGISFYTFAAVGYLIDVERERIEAERSLLDFAVFLSFFPALLAGPIGCAEKFLPQLKTPRCFSYEKMKQGLWRLARGAVKKMVLADTLAIFVDAVYADISSAGGGVWVLAVCAYSFQIYFDFAGYSDLAIGSATILGFELTENFQRPYLAHSVRDFWRRWHISLTSWFTHYLYFPLGGNRKGAVRTYINILIVFAVSGLWHGAAVSFVVWGFLNGVYQVLGRLTAPARQRVGRMVGLSGSSRLSGALAVISTFTLLTVAWIFFRAASVGEALFIVKRLLLIFRDGWGVLNPLSYITLRQALLCVVGVAVFMAEELLEEQGRIGCILKLKSSSIGYWLLLALLAAAVAVFGVYGEAFDPTSFVYFKF